MKPCSTSTAAATTDLKCQPSLLGTTVARLPLLLLLLLLHSSLITSFAAEIKMQEQRYPCIESFLSLRSLAPPVTHAFVKTETHTLPRLFDLFTPTFLLMSLASLVHAFRYAYTHATADSLSPWIPTRVTRLLPLRCTPYLLLSLTYSPLFSH